MQRRNRRTLRDVVVEFLQEHFRSITGVVLAVLLVATVSLGVQWLQDPYRFPLQVVKVDGEYHYLDRARLEQVIAPFVTGGFFGVDVAGLCRKVERLPWVYRARVARHWPDRLTVTIEEQVPVARWGGHGYLNRDGEAFFPEDDQTLSWLPEMSGPAGHERDVLDKYRRITELLAPLGLAVAGLHLDERRAWSLETDTGMRVELGRAETWPRLQRLVDAWPVIFAEHSAAQAGRVDLRYSSGLTVLWQREEAPAGNPGDRNG